MRSLVSLVLLCACAVAQTRDPGTVAQISVAFRNKPGQYRTDMSKDDVQVTEARERQRVVSLEPWATQPRCIAFVVDNSNSNRKSTFKGNTPRVAEAVNAAIGWVRQTFPGSAHRAMVVNFNVDYYVDQKLTESVPQIASAMERLDLRGATALHDAIIGASLELAQEAGPNCQRILVAITDGVHNATPTGQGEAVGAVRRAGASLYVVGLRDRHPGDLVQKLAESTGGIYISAASRGDLQSAFAKLEQDLKSRYRLTYVSMSPQNVRVELAVTVPSAKLNVLAPQFREVRAVPR